MASAISLANSIVSTMPSLPGITGIPEAFIVSLATDLLPILAIACALGPMKMIPISLHISANVLFSAKKP